MCIRDKSKMIQACLEEANEFYEIATKKIELPLHITAYFVNCAFCCELYLKVLAMKASTDAVCKKTHRLDELFNTLPEADRDAIEKKFQEETTTVELQEFLKKEQSAFEKWRYNFEVETLSGSITGFDAFSKALQWYVELQFRQEGK